jgi:hypothetical protein
VLTSADSRCAASVVRVAAILSTLSYSKFSRKSDHISDALSQSIVVTDALHTTLLKVGRLQWMALLALFIYTVALLILWSTASMLISCGCFLMTWMSRAWGATIRLLTSIPGQEGLGGRVFKQAE